MPEFEIRSDVLSTATTAFPQQPGKALGVRRRTMPPLTGSCPLCTLEALVGDGSTIVVNQGVASRPLCVTSSTFALSNPWPAFGPGGRSDLVIARRHVESIDDLSNEEAREFIATVLDVRDSRHAIPGRTLAIMNVGSTANASQPHLHAQVVTMVVDSPSMLSATPTIEDARTDVLLAHDHDLVLRDGSATTVYVPWAPTATGELRVASPDPGTLSDGILAALGHLTSAFGPMDYNILLWGSGPFLAQVLPCFVLRNIYNEYFGVACITLSPATLAATLRAPRRHQSSSTLR